MCPHSHFFGLCANCLHTLYHFLIRTMWTESYCSLLKMNSERLVALPKPTQLISETKTRTHAWLYYPNFYRSALPLMAHRLTHCRNLLDSKCLKAETMLLSFNGIWATPVFIQVTLKKISTPSWGLWLIHFFPVPRSWLLIMLSDICCISVSRTVLFNMVGTWNVASLYCIVSIKYTLGFENIVKRYIKYFNTNHFILITC